jgi:NAD(P)H dehydrogenase (quinone)
MRALVVHAHPDSASFNAVLCHTAVDALQRAGHHVDVIDLYGEQYRAAMTAEERAAYESDSPVSDPMVRRHADLLLAAEILVFVYPTWWWGLPAILKGWLERTLVPGVGWLLNDKNRVRGGLSRVRKVVGITTYGSRRYEMLAMNDAGRRTLLRCIRMLAPVTRCRSTWLGMYGMDTSSEADRAAFVATVAATVGKL